MIVFSAASVSVKVCGQVASTRMQTLDCLQCSEAGASQGGRNVHLYTGGNSWPVITSCIKKKKTRLLFYFSDLTTVLENTPEKSSPTECWTVQTLLLPALHCLFCPVKAFFFFLYVHSFAASMQWNF